MRIITIVHVPGPPGRSRRKLVKFLKHEDFVCQIVFSRRGKTFKHEDSCLERSAADVVLRPLLKIDEALSSS